MVRLADEPPPPPTGVSTSTGGGPDPNTQFIYVGSTTPLCADRFGLACGAWLLTFRFEPADFKLGTFQLGCSNVTSSSDVRGSPGPQGNCFSTGGTFNLGTLEILSLTATTAIVRLTNTSNPDFDSDGIYDITRCP